MRLVAGACVLLLVAAFTPAAATSAGVAGPRPCTLLTSKLANQYAPGVKGGPVTNTADACGYSDRKPVARSRWQITFEIPLLLGVSAAKLWTIYRDSVLNDPSTDVVTGMLPRSKSGADRAVWSVNTSETTSAGPSQTIQIVWVKGRTFGILRIFTPSGKSPSVNESARLLRTLLVSIR